MRKQLTKNTNDRHEPMVNSEPNASNFTWGRHIHKCGGVKHVCERVVLPLPRTEV